ncbi:MAG: Lon protease-like protein [Candidatus Azotimanducaceae bacterium]|jgi:Lon protease-like protein
MAQIPLFPLPSVLFPGGKLPLQIFEPRYLDMVKQCMKDDVGFGIVMIQEGTQILKSSEEQLPSVAFAGTYVSIVDFDQRDNGMLGIVVEGQVKFSIRDQYENSERLMMADVEFLKIEPRESLPDDKAHLGEILASLLEHEAVEALRLSVDLQDASEVGGRLTELLPIPKGLKQRLLEMRNPIARLEDLDKLILKMQNQLR